MAADTEADSVAVGIGVGVEFEVEGVFVVGAGLAGGCVSDVQATSPNVTIAIAAYRNALMDES